MSEDSKGWRMDAYYYGFTNTGDTPIDKILSAVACAGKAFHYTQQWIEDTTPYDHLRGETCEDWIQNAANDAAAEIAALREAVLNQANLISKMMAEEQRVGNVFAAKLATLTGERDEARGELDAIGRKFPPAIIPSKETRLERIDKHLARYERVVDVSNQRADELAKLKDRFGVPFGSLTLAIPAQMETDATLGANIRKLIRMVDSIKIEESQDNERTIVVTAFESVHGPDAYGFQSLETEYFGETLDDAVSEALTVLMAGLQP